MPKPVGQCVVDVVMEERHLSHYSFGSEGRQTNDFEGELL